MLTEHLTDLERIRLTGLLMEALATKGPSNSTDIILLSKLTGTDTRVSIERAYPSKAEAEEPETETRPTPAGIEANKMWHTLRNAT